jgi:hypothetical protein
MLKLEGFFNCKLTVTELPDARPDTAGTVTYGMSLNVFVAFTRVTPAGSDVKTICRGPLIVVTPMFLTVSVPLKVWLTRL